METMPYIWFAIAIAMAIFEGVTYQLVSIWFVIGAVAATIVSIFVPNPLWIQIVVFIAVSLITLLATRPIVKKITKAKALPTNADRYIGMTGVVKTEINNTENTGQVIINGDIWSSKSENDHCINVGEKVIIKDIQGVKLIVSPVKE